MQLLLADSGIYFAGALAAYALFCPRLNYPLYRILLFHPDGYLTEVASRAPILCGIQGRDVTFGGTMGQNLHGWFFENPAARWTILFSHGNAGNLLNRQLTVEFLLNCGVSVFLYDYQGFGKSTGKPTVEGICDDAVAAYDYMTKTENVDPDGIVFYGESLGVGVTTYLSTLRQCRGLILQSGFAALRKIALDLYPPLAVYPTSLFPSPPLDSIAVVKNAHPPLLIMHGMQDGVVPFSHGEAIYAAASAKKSFLRLPQSTHNDMYTTSPQECLAALSEFLESLG